MTTRYARGEHALGECARSGIVMLRKDMVEDGQFPGLLVHPDWYEPPYPEPLKDLSDAVALYRPAPEQSKPEGEGTAAPALSTLIPFP